MTNVAAFIPTRDGKPNFHVANRLSQACRAVGATWGWTANHLSVCTSRNQAVALAKGAKATHLFMCDNDTYVPADAIERLLSLASPIATGCTPTTLKGTRGEIPCINIADDCDEHGQPLFFRHWFDGARQVKWCGASCILIRMDVFERMGFPWFFMDQDWDGRKYTCWSEDLSFCRKANDYGIPIMADGDLRCLHDRNVECSRLIAEEADTYGSHLPVLKDIAASVHVRSAVEYGPGMHSTRALLDRDTFPGLDSLIAFESSDLWHRRIASAFCDPRLNLKLQPLDEFQHVADADLVLIDCGAGVKDGAVDYSVRSGLLRAYEDDQRAVVVLHDSEDPQLTQSVRESSYRYKRTFGLKPETAVLSNREVF